MVITHYGVECFKIQFGDITIAINPISKESKQKTTRFGADIALVSSNHPDFNGIEQVSRGEKEAMIINGPGEYEVSGVTVRGFQTESQYGVTKGKSRLNTVYIINLEDMELCFMGAISSNNFSGALKESLDDIDVLFIPVGGDGVLDPKTAHQIAVKLEPKLVIPMHYDGVGSAKALEVFLKEEGEKNSKPQEKLTLKKKDLSGKEGEVVVLKAQ